MATVAEILNKAADLIEPKGAWVKGFLAKDEQGRGYKDGMPRNPVCFCAEGAVQAAAGKANLSLERQAFDALRRVLPTDFIHEWNDAPDRTQTEVVAALRAAAIEASA